MGVSLLYAAAQHSYKCWQHVASHGRCHQFLAKRPNVTTLVQCVGLIHVSALLAAYPWSMSHPTWCVFPPPKVCMVSHHIIVNIISANGQVVLALGVNTNGGSEDTGGRTMMGDKTHGVRPWCVASAGKLIVVLFFVSFQSLTHHPFLYVSIPSSPTASYLLCLLSPHQCRSIPTSHPL